MFTHYLIIIITTLCFCCAGHGPLTLIKWPMLSGSIIICLCMQEKYYLDPSSLKKNPVPPEDSILCKIMHNWQEFKIMHNWQEFISTVSTHRQNSYTPSIVTSKLKDLQFRIEPYHDPEIKKNENNNWNNPHFNRY